MPDARWETYVAEYHDANPGTTEDLLADARDDAGRSQYDWLLAAVPAGVSTVIDLACGSGPLARRLEGPNGPGSGVDGPSGHGSGVAGPSGHGSGVAGPSGHGSGVADGRVVGVDQSPGELARATGLRVQARVPALPLAGGCAGAVLASMALMLMHPLEAVLAEVARLLRPGGTFVATVPSRGEAGASPLFADLLRTLGQTGVTYPEPLDNGGLAERFSAAGLTLHGDETGDFIRSVPGPRDAEQIVRSFYAPGAGPERVAAAVEKLREAAPVEIAYRIRRLVASR